ncbi:MAG: hypothetical protein HYV26_07720 [Candidatus Hydrogenedentes bacterium]|nr:hypothetical protein [Candidatus Hydrogenedentota bacterium]
MNTLILPARYDIGAALRRLRRRRITNLFGLVPSRPVKVSLDGTPLSIELVWMPAYAFRFGLSGGGLWTHTWISVDASFGGFALFARRDALVEVKPEGERFPAVLDQDTAEEQARDGLIRYILRKRGAKPEVKSIEDVCFYYAPVWVYYYRNLSGKIDFAILDAYTGEPMGSRMRAAIMSGMIAQRKKRQKADKVSVDPNPLKPDML